MFKKIIIVGLLILLPLLQGCSLINLALSAGLAYGMYELTSN